MRSTPKDIETHLTALRATPVVFTDLLDRSTERELLSRPEPDEWSLLEILAHLTACAEVWGDDIERMLTEETLILTKPHPNTIMQIRLGVGRSFAEMTDEFATMRGQLLDRLHAITADQWELGGSINGRHHTVYMRTRRMALHESAHTAHLRKAYPRQPPPEQTP